MPSSIDRSAPAENASLPDVTTIPFTAGSADVCFTISSSSVIVVSSSTFIERPGMSHVTSAMPSASVSTLKFLKAIGRSQFVSPSPLAGEGRETGEARSSRMRGLSSPSGQPLARARFARAPSPAGGEGKESDPLDDRGGTHAAADAERDERSRFVAALELVEHGAQNHRAGCAERMTERDRAAIDVDLVVVDVEGLDVAQHDGREGLVELEQVDVRFLHPRAFE